MIFTQEECKTKPELAPSKIHIYILTNPRISECAAALGDRDFKDDTNPHTWYPYKKTRDHTNTEGRPQEDPRKTRDRTRGHDNERGFRETNAVESRLATRRFVTAEALSVTSGFSEVMTGSLSGLYSRA